mgnify:CR=1 FL=1
MASYTKSTKVILNTQVSGPGEPLRIQTEYQAPVYQGIVHVTALVSTDTIQIQASNDGDNWYNLGNPFNAPEMATVDAAVGYIRALKSGTTAPARVLYYG